MFFQKQTDPQTWLLIVFTEEALSGKKGIGPWFHPKKERPV